MKSPKDMRIIQIDITNSCVFQCSNCTRFCGHHKKPFFMDFETFKRAVDSLDGYVGTIGMMGGEPTLNPDFERMAEYLASKKPKKVSNKMLRPQQHFMDGIHDLEFDHTFLYPCGDGKRQTVDGPGLWATTLGNYKRYYETIQDCIQYQALNDHSNPMYHQPALISRKSLGITDEDWPGIRDNCWIQNVWSASVTPKGAFFCEVAGSLDMLFDGPGGWKIEPGWWKREPKDFGDQLHWCELCGLACHTFMRNANDRVYDVSEDMNKKLCEAGSRLVNTEHINVVEIKDGKVTEASQAKGERFSTSMPYTKSYSARYNEAETKLTYKKIVGVFIFDNIEEADIAIDNAQKVGEGYFYSDEDLLEYVKGKVNANDFVFVDKKDKTIGELLYKALKVKDPEVYALVVRGQLKIKNVVNELQGLVLNPGVLLYSSMDNVDNDFFKSNGSSEALLLNGIAKSLRLEGWDRLLKIHDLTSLKKIWIEGKVLPFVPEIVYKAPADAIVADSRYVIWGAGNGFIPAYDKIIEAGSEVVAVLDLDVKKQGENIKGMEIYSPDWIKNNKTCFDYVMIGSSIYYKEIRDSLLEMGIEEKAMAWI